MQAEPIPQQTAFFHTVFIQKITRKKQKKRLQTSTIFYAEPCEFEVIPMLALSRVVGNSTVLVLFTSLVLSSCLLFSLSNKITIRQEGKISVITM